MGNDPKVVNMSVNSSLQNNQLSSFLILSPPFLNIWVLFTLTTHTQGHLVCFPKGTSPPVPHRGQVLDNMMVQGGHAYSWIIR